MAACNTDLGGGKSGSPTQREVISFIPSACICLTFEKIWTVEDILTDVTNGFKFGGVDGVVDGGVDVVDGSSCVLEYNFVLVLALELEY